MPLTGLGGFFRKIPFRTFLVASTAFMRSRRFPGAPGETRFSSFPSADVKWGVLHSNAARIPDFRHEAVIVMGSGGDL